MNGKKSYLWHLIKASLLYSNNKIPQINGMDGYPVKNRVSNPRPPHTTAQPITKSSTEERTKKKRKRKEKEEKKRMKV
jgi:hypothetical protein